VSKSAQKLSVGKKSSAQSGFTVGAILLTVALMGAITSAVAVASQGSIVSGDKEKNVLTARLIQQQALEYTNSFERIFQSGYARDRIVINSSIIPSYFGAGGGWMQYCSQDVGNFTCAYTGATADVGLPGTSNIANMGNIFKSGPTYAKEWFYWNLGQMPAAYSEFNNRVSVLTIHTIRKDVCEALNRAYNPNWDGVIPPFNNLVTTFYFGYHNGIQATSTLNVDSPTNAMNDTSVFANIQKGNGVCFSSGLIDTGINPSVITYHFSLEATALFSYTINLVLQPAGAKYWKN
jgi:hypothetical protein